MSSSEILAKAIYTLSSSSLFSSLNEIEILDLITKCDWLYLKSGEMIYEQGSEADAAYIVLQGRVRLKAQALVKNKSIDVQITSGELLGELELISMQSRTSSAFASLDSVLLRMNQTSFLHIREKHREIERNLLASFAARLTADQSKIQQPKEKILTLVPLHNNLSLDDFSSKFTKALKRVSKRVLFLNKEIIEQRLGAKISQDPLGQEKEYQLISWLTQWESTYDLILLQADPQDNEWTQRCLRYANKVLLLASSQKSTQSDNFSPKFFEQLSDLPEKEIFLALHHPRSCKQASGTQRWLRAYPMIKEHYHFRSEEFEDLNRLARFMTDQAIKLCLSGGALRGIAHVGVYRALEEANIPVDLVCGASVGATIGAQIGLNWDAQKVLQTSRAHLRDRSFLDPTVPVVSLLAGKKFQTSLYEMYGDTRIEDLWRKFFCVSSNLNNAEVVVHRTGLLREAVQASGALPGIFPPVDGEKGLLVDGVFLDNMPALRSDTIAKGKTIAVNVISEKDALDHITIPKNISKFKLLTNRFSSKSEQKFPVMLDLIMRSFFLGTVSAAKQAREEVDLYIEPPVESFSFMDTKGFDPIEKAGYESSKVLIEEWKQKDPTLPTTLKDSPSARPQLNKIILPD